MLEKHCFWSVFCEKTSTFFDSLFINKRIKKSAFTLTEMLIALVVIAVLAVLILPVITTRAQNKSFALSYESQVKQILNNLIGLHVLENKADFRDTMMYVDPEGNDYSNSSGAYINKYMKVAKYCGDNKPGDCFASKYYVYDDNDRKVFDGFVKDGTTKGPVGACALLKNGSSICIRPQARTSTGGVNQVSGWIDLNGPKGPNVYGRDLRTFHIDLNERFAYSEEEPVEILPVIPPECLDEENHCLPVPPEPCIDHPTSQECCMKKEITSPDDVCCPWHASESAQYHSICYPCPEDDPNCKPDKECDEKTHSITGPEDSCCKKNGGPIDSPACCAPDDSSEYCCTVAKGVTKACCELGIANHDIVLRKGEACCKIPEIYSAHIDECEDPCILDKEANSALGDEWRRGKARTECCDRASRRAAVVTNERIEEHVLPAGPEDACCMYEDVYSDTTSPVASYCCRLQKYPIANPSKIVLPWKKLSVDDDELSDLCCTWRFTKVDLDGKSWLKGHKYLENESDNASNDYQYTSDSDISNRKFDTCCQYALKKIASWDGSSNTWVASNSTGVWSDAAVQKKVWQNCCTIGSMLDGSISDEYAKANTNWTYKGTNLSAECCHFLVTEVDEDAIKAGYGRDGLREVNPKTGTYGKLRNACCGYDEFKDYPECCSMRVDGLNLFRPKDDQWRDICCMPHEPFYNMDETEAPGPSPECCIKATMIQVEKEGKNASWHWSKDAKFKKVGNNRFDGCCNQGSDPYPDAERQVNDKQLRDFPKWWVNCCHFGHRAGNPYRNDGQEDKYRKTEDFVKGCCTTEGENPAGEDNWPAELDDVHNEDCCWNYGGKDDPHSRDDMRWLTRCCGSSFTESSDYIKKPGLTKYRYYITDGGCCKNVTWVTVGDVASDGTIASEDNCCTLAVNAKTGKKLREERDDMWYAHCCEYVWDYKDADGTGYAKYRDNCCINAKKQGNSSLDGLRLEEYGGEPNNKKHKLLTGASQYQKECCDSTISEGTELSGSSNCCWDFVNSSSLTKDFDEQQLTSRYRGLCCRAYGEDNNPQGGSRMIDQINFTCAELWLCEGHGKDRGSNADSSNNPGYGLPTCCEESSAQNTHEIWKGGCCEFPTSYTNNVTYRQYCCHQSPNVDYTRVNNAAFNSSTRGTNDPEQKKYCCKPDIVFTATDNNPANECCRYFKDKDNYNSDNDGARLSDAYIKKCCSKSTGSVGDSVTDYCPDNSCALRWATGKEYNKPMNPYNPSAEWKQYDFAGCCKAMHTKGGGPYTGTDDDWANNCCDFVGNRVSDINKYYGSHENFRAHCCVADDTPGPGSCSETPNAVESLNAECCNKWGAAVESAGTTIKNNCCSTSFATSHASICESGCSNTPNVAESLQAACCNKWGAAVDSAGTTIKNNCCSTSYATTHTSICGSGCSNNPTDADATKKECCLVWGNKLTQTAYSSSKDICCANFKSDLGDVCDSSDCDDKTWSLNGGIGGDNIPRATLTGRGLKASGSAYVACTCLISSGEVTGSNISDVVYSNLSFNLDTTTSDTYPTMLNPCSGYYGVYACSFLYFNDVTVTNNGNSLNIPGNNYACLGGSYETGGETCTGITGSGTCGGNLPPSDCSYNDPIESGISPGCCTAWGNKVASANQNIKDGCCALLSNQPTYCASGSCPASPDLDHSTEEDCCNLWAGSVEQADEKIKKNCCATDYSKSYPSICTCISPNVEEATSKECCKKWGTKLNETGNETVRAICCANFASDLGIGICSDDPCPATPTLTGFRAECCDVWDKDAIAGSNAKSNCCTYWEHHPNRTPPMYCTCGTDNTVNNCNCWAKNGFWGDIDYESRMYCCSQEGFSYRDEKCNKTCEYTWSVVIQSDGHGYFDVTMGQGGTKIDANRKMSATINVVQKCSEGYTYNGVTANDYTYNFGFPNDSSYPYRYYNNSLTSMVCQPAGMSYVNIVSPDGETLYSGSNSIAAMFNVTGEKGCTYTSPKLSHSLKDPTILIAKIKDAISRTIAHLFSEIRMAIIRLADIKISIRRPSDKKANKGLEKLTKKHTNVYVQPAVAAEMSSSDTDHATVVDGDASKSFTTVEPWHCCDPKSKNPSPYCCEKFRDHRIDDVAFYDFDDKRLPQEYILFCCSQHGICPNNKICTLDMYNAYVAGSASGEDKYLVEDCQVLERAGDEGLTIAGSDRPVWANPKCCACLNPTKHSNTDWQYTCCGEVAGENNANSAESNTKQIIGLVSDAEYRNYCCSHEPGSNDLDSSIYNGVVRGSNDKDERCCNYTEEDNASDFCCQKKASAKNVRGGDQSADSKEEWVFTKHGESNPAKAVRHEKFRYACCKKVADKYCTCSQIYRKYDADSAGLNTALGGINQQVACCNDQAISFVDKTSEPLWKEACCPVAKDNTSDVLGSDAKFSSVCCHTDSKYYSSVYHFNKNYSDDKNYKGGENQDERCCKFNNLAGQDAVGSAFNNKGDPRIGSGNYFCCVDRKADIHATGTYSQDARNAACCRTEGNEGLRYGGDNDPQCCTYKTDGGNAATTVKCCSYKRDGINTSDDPWTQLTGNLETDPYRKACCTRYANSGTLESNYKFCTCQYYYANRTNLLNTECCNALHGSFGTSGVNGGGNHGSEENWKVNCCQLSDKKSETAWKESCCLYKGAVNGQQGARGYGYYDEENLAGCCTYRAGKGVFDRKNENDFGETSSGQLDGCCSSWHSSSDLNNYYLTRCCNKEKTDEDCCKHMKANTTRDSELFRNIFYPGAGCCAYGFEQGGANELEECVDRCEHFARGHDYYYEQGVKKYFNDNLDVKAQCCINLVGNGFGRNEECCKLANPSNSSQFAVTTQPSICCPYRKVSSLDGASPDVYALTPSGMGTCSWDDVPANCSPYTNECTNATCGSDVNKYCCTLYDQETEDSHGYTCCDAGMYSDKNFCKCKLTWAKSDKSEDCCKYHDYECCNSSNFSSYEKFCCLAGKNDTYSACCDYDEYFSDNATGCCNAGKRETCECCDEGVGTYSTCCGCEDYFDDNKSSCCSANSGKGYGLANNYDCCGNSTYFSKNKDSCCEDGYGSDSDCCSNDEYFASNKKSCCDGGYRTGTDCSDNPTPDGGDDGDDKDEQACDKNPEQCVDDGINIDDGNGGNPETP